jgi:type II restriction/modification system DNA methylase subunit YeeA
MNEGGFFGIDEIRRFNGNLFETGPVLTLTAPEIDRLYQAARLDWSAVDPSIFGTLFERGMDPAKRSQLGAHYTSREDIETLVEPVVMKPLRREWREVQELVANVLETGKKRPKEKDRSPAAPLAGPKLKKARREAETLLGHFHQKLAQIHVLDPACGSGNFLYVTLQKLKDLEKEVIVFALDNGLQGRIPLVGPWQLHGIEINPYAFELAQMTVWIGYLQWLHQNPFGVREDPVLRRMDTFECKDAILDLSDPEAPKEPEWPKVDYIVGNPPFLGGKRLRGELGDEYVEALFRVWAGRVPAEADLVTYWFEKARAQIDKGDAKRAGLLATQGIRGGVNRQIIQRIMETGGLFFAISDRDWILDGAMVHMSMIAFDAGAEHDRELDGVSVEQIHANLTAKTDLTVAQRLIENRDLSFMGDSKGGRFEIAQDQALELMRAPNPHDRPNSDVIVPWVGGLDINSRNRGLYIIDFGARMTEVEAAKYELPFQRLRELVWPERQTNRRPAYRDRWWIHVEPRAAMRDTLGGLEHFLATTRHGPHRYFRWVDHPSLPDSALIVFAGESMAFFGLLENRAHELWSRAQGTQVRERESGFRYTPTTCFETFPFPTATDEQQAAIATAARELDELRERWLNPPEWVTEEVLEFPGAVDGPWARFVHDPDERGIGTVRYPRLVPRDDAAAAQLARRTLTNLYNQRPAWLDHAHRKLDEAVLAAYGWPPDLADEEILSRLLALNLERAG